LASQIVKIVREKHGPFLAGTIATERVDGSAIEPLLTGSFHLEFIVNIPRESYWTGEAIDLVTQNSVAFGGFGDLISAVSLPDVRQYVNKEFAFAERILSQHSAVADIKRVYDRLYLVKRTGLSDVRIALLNAYDLTADHVRTARARYGKFSAIFHTNPSGRPTSAAQAAAASIGARICTCGQLLGWLNNP
jgi:hypothetical protein